MRKFNSISESFLTNNVPDSSSSVVCVSCFAPEPRFGQQCYHDSIAYFGPTNMNILPSLCYYLVGRSSFVIPKFIILFTISNTFFEIFFLSRFQIVDV